jgi:hypothetical protein
MSLIPVNIAEIQPRNEKYLIQKLKEFEIPFSDDLLKVYFYFFFICFFFFQNPTFEKVKMIYTSVCLNKISNIID